MVGIIRNEWSEWSGIRSVESVEEVDEATSGPIDAFHVLKQRAILAVTEDAEIKNQIERTGSVPWFVIGRALEQNLPETMENRNVTGFGMVPEVLNILFEGEENEGWKTEKKENKEGKSILWVIKLLKPSD